MSELYEELKSKLKVCKLNAARTEINIRCPYCGDSIKDPFKGHLYIQNQSPYKYYCQRCQSSGIVNRNFLELLSCDNYSLLNRIEKEFKEYKKKVKIKYGSNLSFLSKKVIVFPKPLTKNDITKKKYVEERLGITLTEEDINTYKIVFSLKRFLKDNNMDILDKNINNKFFMMNVNKIEDYCVGFLSADKSTIIFRSLDKDKTGYRYNNFTIFPEVESKKTYILSNKIDLSKDVFDIYITEGIFDIIGVYNHIQNKKMSDNTLYIANAGKSYMVTSGFIKKLAILNANINIYSDSDVDIKFYKDLIMNEPFFEMNGINVYYNNKGKDFGVDKNSILISKKIEL